MSEFHTSNFPITDLTPLAEVHDLILHHLKFLAPAKLLRLNHTYYEELLPVVYETLSIDKSNFEGILVGWEISYKLAKYGNWSAVAGRSKGKAFRHVKNVHIADWTAVHTLYRIYHKIVEKLQQEDLFPTVQHLHISAQVVLDRARALSSISPADQQDWIDSGRSDDWLALTQSWVPLFHFLSIKPYHQRQL